MPLPGDTNCLNPLNPSIPRKSHTSQTFNTLQAGEVASGLASPFPASSQPGFLQIERSLGLRVEGLRALGFRV